MNQTEIARLLALDARRPRFAGGPAKRSAYLFDSYVRARIEILQAKAAIRDLLERVDRPPSGFTHAMARRMDEIRELAK